MEMKVLHERWKDNDSPSVEGQIRWLQKQGFAQHHIEQAMIGVYGDIDFGKVPMVYRKGDEIIYRLSKDAPPDERWQGAEIKTGNDLDQVILMAAKQARTDELSAQIAHMEQFMEKLRQKWAEEQKPSLWQRIFSRKKK